MVFSIAEDDISRKGRLIRTDPDPSDTQSRTKGPVDGSVQTPNSIATPNECSLFFRAGHRTSHSTAQFEFFALCEALIGSGLGLKWDCPNGVRIDSLFPEMHQVMQKAGCEALAVGIESGTSRVRKLIDKRVTVEKTRDKAEMIAGCSGIKLTGYFMIGFPDETEEEI